MLRTASRRWRNSDSHSQGNLQPSSSGLSCARAGSIRLHGFQQKRALRHGGLRTVEVNYLNYAADGDVQIVEMMFKKYSDEQLNRNCTDYFDRTALTLAITNHRNSMIQYLLKAGVDLTESFFYAIENEYTEAVEYILNSETAQRTGHGEMLITSEESIFSRFLSPIMLAAHKNNYEILEILYNHGHRLRNHSVNASNKWDEMRLKWLYYKARASQAYMILMYNKEKIDTLNEAIELYGTLTMEGLATREVRENYKELASQCEEFAIALLDQLRTAQELADILRFSLVGREHGNTGQLVLNTIPLVMPPSPSEDVIDGRSSLCDRTVLQDPQSLDNWPDMASRQSPAIQVTNTDNRGTLGRRVELANAPRNLEAERQHGTAEWIRSVTNAQVAVTPHMDTLRRITAPIDSTRLCPASTDLDQRRLSQAIDNVPQERRRTMGIRGQIDDSGNLEYARPIHFLKPIEKAVNNGMVRLVTCQNSQLALTYLKDGILFRDCSPATGLAKKFLVALMFPIISLAFYVFPNSRLGLVARNPTAKLWMEVASDICLIILLVLNLLLSEYNVFSPNEFSPLLILAYFWMPGKFINLMFLAYHQGKQVLYSIWNWNDTTTILLYTGFMILRIYALTLKEEDRTRSQWSPIPLADMMISMVYILVFLRPLEILRVNRTFGPLQVSVDRMLKDVTKFFLLFLVIWFAFSSGINTLFWRYRGPCSAGDNINNSMADKYCCFDNNSTEKFTDLGTSLQVHFWSIFGYSDEYSSWFDLTCLEGAKKVVTARFGEGIFALYHIGTVLVLVNMLIAIMSGTLQKTIDDSDIQWQFHRTRVWIRFIRTGFYRPAPMNILPRPKEILFVFKALAKGCRTMCRCVKRDRDHSDHAYETRVNLQSFRKGGKLELEGPVETRFDQSPDNMSRDSANVATAEERGSRYDVTLQKCVKRYLKTNVVQGDELTATPCKKDEE